MNGHTATQLEEYFRHPLAVTNSTAQVWQSIAVNQITGGTTNTLSSFDEFVPKDPETLT